MGATIKPTNFISWIPTGTVGVSPRLFASVIIVPSPTRRRADTVRRIAEPQEQNADTERDVFIPDGGWVKPNDFISWIPVGKVTVKPKVYASYIFVPSPTNVRADMSRDVVATNDVVADSLRDVVCKNLISGDGLRQIKKSENVNSDANRKITNANSIPADTERNIFIPDGGWIKPINFVSWIPNGKITVKPQLFASYLPIDHTVYVHGDLLRRLSAPALIPADTERELQYTDIAYADTRRKVGSSVITEVESDTARIVGVKNIVCGDLSRAIKSTDTVSGDTSRIVLVIVTATFDTSRSLGIGNTATADTKRIINKRQQAHGDTILRVPFVLEYFIKPQNRRLLKKSAPVQSISDSFRDHGIRSLNITLGEMTLSDTFQLETVNPMEIEQAVQGQFLDFPLNFLVEETSQQNLIQTIKGMYSVDKMLYSKLYLYFGENDVVWSSWYATVVGDALGLQTIYRADDFIPSQDFSSGVTYADIISSVFGWTYRLPHRQINIFIRGDNLYVVQRGQEMSTIDISGLPHSRPIINRKLVRTLWSSSGNDTDKAHSEEDAEPVPFTGKIGTNGVYRYFENGYLVKEDDDGNITRYSYSGGYLVEKNTETKAIEHSETSKVTETTVRTTYIYDETERDIYLCKELEITKKIETEQKNDRIIRTETNTERVTYHAPIGYGWYSTSVYVDGEFEGSSLSQGKPGNKAGQFMIDESNLSLGSHRVTYGGYAPYSALIDTEFPVKGDDYLAILTDEIEWLNRKKQENVYVDIISNVVRGVPEIQHIIDFTEKIRLDGNEYFLVSNQVSFTPREFRQKLQLVRWYA